MTTPPRTSPGFQRLWAAVRSKLFKRKPIFESSPQYWESRYQRNGTSGAGSYGRLAEFKAEVLNDFVLRRNIQSVIEFGCGDGNQLSLARYPGYIGVDVAPSAIQLCTARFAGDSTKRFVHSREAGEESAELSLSLDVIYHLIEDQVFDQYLTSLFRAGSRFVVIYSSNHDEVASACEHVKHRRFTDWVRVKAPGFLLIETIPNRYPYDKRNASQTSFADFYVFQRMDGA